MSASTTLPPIETTAAAPSLSVQALPESGLPGWKDEVAERLRAHRTRRPRRPGNQPDLPGLAGAPSAVAARVAERYARVPSWRDALAAEAAAKAAAEAAAREAAVRAGAAARAEAAAKAAAEAAAQLEAAAVASSAATRAAMAADAGAEQGELPARRPVRSASFLRGAALPVADFAGEESGEREPLQQDLNRCSVSTDSLPTPRSTPSQACAAAPPRSSVRQVVDLLEEAMIEPARTLPARVIEFPRELIAPRKARPRIAEGPLLEPADTIPAAVPAPEIPGVNVPLSGSAPSSRLRIFEADPEEQPAACTAQARFLPEWHSIHLDSGETMPDTSAAFRGCRVENLPLYVASFEDRVMAGIVDLALTLAAFLLFVLVFAVCTTHLPGGTVAAGGAAATLLATWILYQLIFFSLSSATPGMRYAKIALCTFKDENPTRLAMRGRILAMLLAALPLGLGFLWAAFDEDRLGWHDRITGTYQRSYRGL